MSPLGKIIFSLLGLFYFGIIGLLVGLVVGHLCVDENEIIKKFVSRHPYLRKLLSEFSKIRIQIPSEVMDIFSMGRRYVGNPFDNAGNLREARDITFVQSISVLISCMSEAEFASDLYKKELDAFLNAFVAPPYMVKPLTKIFEKARMKKTGFENSARQIGIMLPESPLAKNDIVRLLFKIANLDGKISSKELNYLRRVSILFGVPNSTFAKISEEFDRVDDKDSAGYGYEGVQAPSIAKDPYRIIGVDRSFSDEDIKKVYRNLIRQNHPDTLMAAGAGKDEIDAANRFMAEVNSAYDAIEKERRKK